MDDVIKNLRPCLVTFQSNSVYIKSKLGSYMFTSNGGRLTGKELGFIKRFRNYFVKNGKDIKCDLKLLSHHNVYFKFFVTSGIHTDVVELDIDNAYPTAGKILGIVPNELYEESQTFFDEDGRRRKEAGLIAIGSLYRNRRIVKVDKNGKRSIVQDGERLEYLSNLWKSITSYTDITVESISRKTIGNIYFYWCDALFVKKSEVENVKKLLLKRGFTCKEIKIKKLEFKDNQAISYRASGEIKKFSLPKISYSMKSLDDVISRHRRNNLNVK